MKTLLSKIALSFALLYGGQNLAAQDYAEYAKKVREDVWAWDMPEFKNYTVPEEYKNESAVILAKHDRIMATGKSRFRINQGLWFSINKELLYANTEREMVKINDKASLENYSSLTFKEQTKYAGYMMTSKFKTVVGVRIIKPDGTVNEVDVETESVEITEDEKGKNDYKKLAISNLQEGDILDWFIQEEGHIDTQNMSPLDFVFCNRYPMLSYSVHCEIGRKLTTEYLVINGAPDFDVSTNENDDVILSVQKNNIPKIEGYDRWVSPYRELPMLRMSILNNTSKNIWKPKTARESGLHKNIPSSTILDDVKCAYGTHISLWYSTAAIKETNKMVKAYIQRNPGVSKEDLAAYIYDALQYNMENVYYRSPIKFFASLTYLLQYHKIDFKLAFSSKKYDAPIDALANRDDVYYFVLANGDKQIFTYDYPFSIAGEVDPDFEGETAVTMSDYKTKGKTLVGTEGRFTVPYSDEKYNLAVVDMDVLFADDLLTLDIDRKITNKGNLKREFQRNFYIYDKWQEELRAHLGVEASVTEEMEKKRSSRKYIDNYLAITEQSKEALKERFHDEIIQYHDAAPKNLIECSVEHLGVSTKHPDFMARVHYQQEGLIQKAGNNYILNAGKLIGGQIDLKGEDRKRILDVYMPTARAYDYHIRIQIPDGYAVENTDGLCMQIDNMAGSFQSSAKFDGKTLTIDTRKVYKTAFLEHENWEALLQMLDKTVEFCAQSVIVKKL